MNTEALNKIHWKPAATAAELEALAEARRQYGDQETALLDTLLLSGFALRLRQRGNPDFVAQLLQLGQDSAAVIEAAEARLAMLKTAQARLLALDFLTKGEADEDREGE